MLEDAAGSWRLDGDWKESDGDAMEIGTLVKPEGAQ